MGIIKKVEMSRDAACNPATARTSDSVRVKPVTEGVRYQNGQERYY